MSELVGLASFLHCETPKEKNKFQLTFLENTENTSVFFSFGAIHKLRHMNFMIFTPPPFDKGDHISETPPSVSSHILQLYT